MFELNWQYIDERCLSAISNAQARGFENDATLYYTMYHTGLRISEIHTCQNWQILGNGDFLVPAHKRGNMKIVPRLRVDPFLINKIETAGEYRYFNSIKYYREQFIFDSGLGNIWVGNKRATLHCTRHAFIHRHNAAGETIESIKEQLGTRNTSTILEYLNTRYFTSRYH